MNLIKLKLKVAKKIYFIPKFLNKESNLFLESHEVKILIEKFLKYLKRKEIVFKILKI